MSRDLPWTLDHWIAVGPQWAKAVEPIHDDEGNRIAPGTVGMVADYDLADGYVMVEFDGHGAIPCWPTEVEACGAPAAS